MLSLGKKQSKRRQIAMHLIAVQSIARQGWIAEFSRANHMLGHQVRENRCHSSKGLGNIASIMQTITLAVFCKINNITNVKYFALHLFTKNIYNNYSSTIIYNSSWQSNPDLIRALWGQMITFKLMVKYYHNDNRCLRFQIINHLI